MINLLHQRKNAHYIRLSQGFRSDLQWWKVFATTWNGNSYLSSKITSRFASGTWGCSAWHGNSWFQWQWGPVSRPGYSSERTTTYHPAWQPSFGGIHGTVKQYSVTATTSSRVDTTLANVQAAGVNAHAALSLFRRGV